MKYFDRFFQPAGWEEKNFTAADGVTMRYGHARPPHLSDAEIKGTVIMTTGYGDYIESYYDTIHEYLGRGYDVWIMDWAGQGGSGRRAAGALAEKAFGVADHVAHLHQFRHQIVAPQALAGKPTILSSHSLGGQIGLNYMHLYPKDFDAAVLAAPLIDFGLSGFARALLSGIFKSASAMGWRDAAIKGGRAGIQKQAVAERKKMRPGEPVRVDLHRTFFALAKPLGAQDPSVALIDSLFDSTTRMNEEVVLRNLDTPVLLGVAGKDHIVNNKAIERAAALLPDARVIAMDDATHGIWQDKPAVQNTWWAAVDGFLADCHARWLGVNAAPVKPVIPPQPPAV